MNWELKAEFIKRPGWTKGKVESKIRRKVWTRGVEFAIVDGTTFINPKAVEQWITQEALDQREIKLKSVTSGKVSDIESLFPKSQIKPTSKLLLV